MLLNLACHACSGFLGTKMITLSNQQVLQTKFEPSERMSTYLLAFIVSEFTSINSRAEAKVLVRQQRSFILNDVETQHIHVHVHMLFYVIGFTVDPYMGSEEGY